MPKKKKTKKWLHFRHRIMRNILYVLLYPYVRLKYGMKVERFKNPEKRQHLIVMNHQTAFDQFFVGMAFKGAVYYVASEDLFSNGFVSRLIEHLVAPIPIKKQATDVHAVMTCRRVVKEGGTIALAPEGNRTFSGKTEYIKPSIVGLVRILKLPLAIFRIEGGYGVQPRWSDVIRKGKMRAYVSKVIEPEEYLALSDEELFELIKKELYVNEAAPTGIFKHKKRAEYLERAVYYCPYCGLSRFESHNDIIECKKCGRKIRYGIDKTLSGVGFDFPYPYVNDWYEAQNEFVHTLDIERNLQTPMYEDCTRFSEVILYKKKKLISKNAKLRLYSDRIEVETEKQTIAMPFKDITVATVLGRNKLNVYFDGKVYQCKSDKRFNALRYVNMCYHYKNLTKGEENDKFLGL